MNIRGRVSTTALEAASSAVLTEDRGLAISLRICLGGQELSVLATVTTFGTAVDVNLAKLSVEPFLPAHDPTARALQAMAIPAPAG